MNIQERVHGIVDTVKENAAGAKLAATTALLVVGPNMTALAAEGDAGTNLLDGEVMSAINKAFGDLAVTATQVVAIAVVTGCSIIGMTAAAKYAMKKIKGVLSSAA